MSDVQILRQLLKEAGRDVPEQEIAGWDLPERTAAHNWAKARRLVDCGFVLNAFCPGHDGNTLGLMLPCICVPPRPECIDQCERDPFEMATA